MFKWISKSLYFSVCQVLSWRRAWQAAGWEGTPGVWSSTCRWNPSAPKIVFLRHMLTASWGRGSVVPRSGSWKSKKVRVPDVRGSIYILIWWVQGWQVLCHVPRDTYDAAAAEEFWPDLRMFQTGFVQERQRTSDCPTLTRTWGNWPALLQN